MECVDRSDGVAADLCAEVPSSEAVILLAIHLPHLVDDVLVVLDLVAHVLGVPIYSRVIKSEVELHAVLLRKTAEHVDKVYRRHVASLLEKIWGRIGYELAVSASDVDHSVDSDRLHVGEILIPFLLAPVLVRDVV